jgi:hypothetical protein
LVVERSIRLPEHARHKSHEDFQLQQDRHNRRKARQSEKQRVWNVKLCQPWHFDKLPPLDELSVAEVIAIDVPHLQSDIADVQDGHEHLRHPRLP